MIPIVIIIISILLDGILTNILPYTVNNLSIFTPMFTILIPIIICPCMIQMTRSTPTRLKKLLSMLLMEAAMSSPTGWKWILRMKTISSILN